MTAIATILEGAGFDTFLPHRDGLEPYVLRFSGGALPAVVPSARDRVDRAIFALDVYELLDRCDAVVCNLNGRVPDEGMVVEASLAFAVGKPIVLYKADSRAPFGGRDNAMITALGRGGIEDHLERLPDRVRHAIAGGRGTVAPSPDLAKAVEALCGVWEGAQKQGIQGHWWPKATARFSSTIRRPRLALIFSHKASSFISLHQSGIDLVTQRADLLTGFGLWLFDRGFDHPILIEAFLKLGIRFSPRINACRNIWPQPFQEAGFQW